MAKVGTVEALRKIIGSPNQHVPLKIHQELNARAIEWSQTRGARSGRVAIQFVRNLAGEMGKTI